MKFKEGRLKRFTRRKSSKNFVGLVIFSLAVLLLTRIDYLVNSIFYNFGLQFSYGWYNEYQLLYALSYQLVIGLIFLWTRDFWLSVILEVFVLSAGQDLIYFGLWNLGKFPNDQWTWMPFYQILGFWDTTSQFALTINSVAVASFIVLILRRRVKSVS